MQFFKNVMITGVALATAVQAIPQGHDHAQFHRQSSSAVAAGSTDAATGAAQTQVETATAVQTGSNQQTTFATQGTGKANGGSATKTASGATSSSTSGSSSSGGKGVTVKNSCQKAITVTVSQGGTDQSPQTVGAGESPSFPISGSAMNLKIGYPSDPTNIAQVEYSTYSGLLAWDLSLINGNPFKADGQSLVPDGTGSGGTCIPVKCAPNQFPCPHAYNSNADNSKSTQPTLTCDQGTTLTFTACTG